MKKISYVTELVNGPKLAVVLFFYIPTFILGVRLTSELHQFRSELSSFRGSVVYDLDKVRSELFEEMNYMYIQGCKYGTQYPDEYKESPQFFNAHSPIIYCQEEKQAQWDDYILRKAAHAGKKE
jgi:hypothetical protein